MLTTYCYESNCTLRNFTISPIKLYFNFNLTATLSMRQEQFSVQYLAQGYFGMQNRARD